MDEWVELNGSKVPKVHNPIELFMLLTGMEPDEWRKAIYRNWQPDPMGSLAEYV